MAYTTINKSTDNFNTKLWSGNGSSQALTGVGHQTDMVWIKSRTDTRKHNLYDVVRGVQKRIVPNDTVAEDTVPGVTAFGTDGFTVGSETDTNGGSRNFVGWSWKGNGAGSANSDGDIASTVSANTTAGFSIVKWTSNGSDNNTIGHGLGVAPKIVLYKRTDGTGPWYLVYKYVDGTLDYLILNDTNAKADLTLGTYGFTTSSTITNLGFGNTHELIAYCFAEKPGYSKFGSYKGNGSSNGTFVYCGFKPAFIMVKRSDGGSENWFMLDNKRDDGMNPRNSYIMTNSTNAEDSNNSTVDTDFLSNGFKLRATTGALNGNGNTYIFMAFGQTMVGSNDIPTTAR